ncbi:hypothetical protein AWZ03_007997 [Drosophila navojoa]|uniref:Uncharacterized protein n=1 Tax=Drosophila navojoa TaxID=7232 RepID=A0A484B9N2_DRONA|nr:hypothetical protein AWZ03_007997 [Drosophila navojoa]
MNESLMGSKSKSKSKSKYKYKHKSNERKSTMAESRRKSHSWHISNMAEKARDESEYELESPLRTTLMPANPTPRSRSP